MELAVQIIIVALDPVTLWKLADVSTTQHWIAFTTRCQRQPRRTGYFIAPSEGYDIAHLQICSSRPKKMQEANAQYIVTAVNSHEKLVEALQAAIKWMDFVHDKLGDADLDHNIRKYGARKYVKQFGEGAGYRASDARAALQLAEAGAVAVASEISECSECGHPFKVGDETHYPECSRIADDEEPTMAQLTQAQESDLRERFKARSQR